MTETQMNGVRFRGTRLSRTAIVGVVLRAVTPRCAIAGHGGNSTPDANFQPGSSARLTARISSMPRSP